MTKTSLLKPYYPNLPIGDVAKVAKVLGVHPKILRDIAKRSDSSYTQFEVPTNSGKMRDVFEPKFELKKIQKRINARIFEKIQFPTYLTGGIKDERQPRDWVLNAAAHCRPATLIKLDIKNFYGNIKDRYVHDVFLYFFKFPPDVADILTELTTLRGRLPQGACTSSYLANLVFFNYEYSLVSYLVHSGYRYSRLLDDITISSDTRITPETATALIKKVAALCKKLELKLRNDKTTIDQADNPSHSFNVTGVWVKHAEPKLKRTERRFIRQLVYACECSYGNDPCSISHHELWNRASGKVAKMQRFRHSQTAALRSRLSNVKPMYDLKTEKELHSEVSRLCRRRNQIHRIGHVKRVNRAFYKLGVLARSNRSLSQTLRSDMMNSYGVKVAIKTSDYWLK